MEPSSHTGSIFTSEELSEIAGGQWTVHGPENIPNAFANVAEADSLGCIRAIYTRQPQQEGLTPAVIVQRVTICRTHEGARSVFKAISEPLARNPAMTPLQLVPGMVPLLGAGHVDGRWIDPSTTSGIGTWKVPTQESVMWWGIASRMGKNSVHHFIIEGHDEEEKNLLCKQIILATITNRQ